jgi:Fe-S oxidoreductase
VEEALETGATILATACPYCIAMFEDSIRTLNADDKIKVKDVSELFLESLEINIDEPAANVCATN